MDLRSDKVMVVVVIVVFLVAMLGLIYFFARTGTASIAPVNEVKIVVNYSGDWSGTIVNDSNFQKLNGTGPETFYASRATSGPINGTLNAAAFVYVADDNIGNITVSIERMDGTIIQTSSADEISLASVDWTD